MRYLLIFGFFFFTACKHDKLPKDIIPPAKMEAVFWDYVQADVFAKDFVSLDSTKNAVKENALLQEAVFNKHNISREVFDKSYKYYVVNEKLMTALLDSISSKQNLNPKSRGFLKNIQIDEKTIQ